MTRTLARQIAKRVQGAVPERGCCISPLYETITLFLCFIQRRAASMILRHRTHTWNSSCIDHTEAQDEQPTGLHSSW